MGRLLFIPFSVLFLLHVTHKTLSWRQRLADAECSLGKRVASGRKLSLALPPTGCPAPLMLRPGALRDLSTCPQARSPSLHCFAEMQRDIRAHSMSSGFLLLTMPSWSLPSSHRIGSGVWSVHGEGGRLEDRSPVRKLCGSLGQRCGSSDSEDEK